MSINQSTTTAADEPVTEQLLTGLRQALAITELLSLHYSSGRFTPAWNVVINLLEQLIALAYSINQDSALVAGELADHPFTMKGE